MDIENKKCYLCGSFKYIIRPGKVRDNERLKVLECQDCGLVRLSSFSHINEGFYEQSSMHEELDYFSWFKETFLDDERRYEYLKSMIVNKKLLDFGCGNGGFLNCVKKFCKSVSGVELEKAARNKIEKNIKVKVYEKIDDVEEKFDIVTMFHVLEHIEDPYLIMQKIIQRVDENGSIIIEVPNANDALLTLYENYAFMEFTYWSCHLYLYTGENLRMLAKKFDLQINYIKQIQRYSLANHLYWLAKNAPGGHEKWMFLDSKEIKLHYEQVLASIGVCDTLIASFSLKK